MCRTVWASWALQLVLIVWVMAPGGGFTGYSVVAMASAPNGAAPEADPDMARLAQLLEQFEPQSGAALPASLPGKAHQLLRDLQAHLSGVAWGKTVKEMAAFGAPTAAKPEENRGGTGRATVSSFQRNYSPAMFGRSTADPRASGRPDENCSSRKRPAVTVQSGRSPIA